MTKTELTTWFEDEWWPRYLNFVKTPFKTQWGAGAKGKALTKFLQINPSEELRMIMLNSIIAQTRHRRLLYDRLGSQKAYDNHTAPLAKGGEAVYQNRQGSTYLFNRGWTDEIPALEMEESQVRADKNCKCGQPVHGPKYDECQDCMGFKDGKLKEYLGKRYSFGELVDCYSARPVKELRAYYKAHPEIQNFGQQQAVEFMKNKLRTITHKKI